MQYKKIIYSQSDGIGKIVLNSPQNYNAIDAEIAGEILEALKKCEDSDEVKVVLISGAGKNFSVGGDIRMMVQSIQTKQLDALDEGIRRAGLVSLAIKKMKKPVVALVHGAVVGAGFNIALACDFILAAEDSNFVQAFVNIGLVPDAGGVFLLTRAIGVNRTNDLIMTGRSVSATEGKEMGLVHMVVANENLEQQGAKFASKLARGPSIAFGIMKELIYVSEYQGFEAYIHLEDERQRFCGRTEDFKEGIQAFLEKRRPDFQGK